MKYQQKFKSLIEKTDLSYIGVGNPTSKIFLIGKEPAVTKGSFQYAREILANRTDWIENVKEGVDYESKFFKDDKTFKYNPLYPYRGQQIKIDKPNGMTGGTSRTWYAYQKLYDMIVGNTPKAHDDIMDFHKYVFSSDMSDESAKSSDGTDSCSTLTSVIRRKEIFKALDYFPIIILAVGHYPKIYNFDIERTFGVEWDGNTISIGNHFMNIHYDKTRSKMLIHTNQLSSFSYDLLNGISGTVRDFVIRELSQGDVKRYVESE